MRDMSKPVAVIALLLAAAGATACKTARAATPIDRPSLDVPPPPERVIEVTLPVDAPQPEPVGEVPSAPSGGTPVRPRPPRDQTTAKPETKPDTPPEAAPPAPPPANPPQLRAPGIAGGPETAAEIRAILDRANTLLTTRIDYRTLNAAQKTSYDTAKRFAAEGEKELKASNYVLAKDFAEKAERLAKELQSR